MMTSNHTSINKYSYHARNAIENGFDLIIVADVTASAGEEALKGRSHQL